ncbi:MAG: lipoate--protein ligase family protein [Actinobacteria bacterium]|nr:lipoate--protein ligase family protein [Actinomycetota bacterium]
MIGDRWGIERHVGSAAAFHARTVPSPARRTVWWFEVAQPAVALGSTQSLEVVDEELAKEAGVDVVRRRSGGGAVWLEPDGVTWVDVLLPAGDPHWSDDVGRSALWLGRIWADVLTDVGVCGATVHTGPLARTEDSGLVCFAGLAPGEVVVRGRKVVGVSQRRTRDAARFQCAVLHRWDPTPLVDVLALDEGERAALGHRLADVATGIGRVAPATVVATFLARLRAA